MHVSTILEIRMSLVSDIPVTTLALVLFSSEATRKSSQH